MVSRVSRLCCALIAVAAVGVARPAAAQDTIKVAYIDPFSGPFASGGALGKKF
jgi:branched-chain amino acid transport system substrate-binding protein